MQELGVQKRSCCVQVMACKLAVRESFPDEEGQPKMQVRFKRTGPSLGGAIATFWILVDFDPIGSLGPR